MASGDGPKWPEPIIFDDDNPKGTAIIQLSVPKLRVKGLVNKSPKNGTVKHDLCTGSVSVQVEVDGVEYYYKKDLPEDINANASAVKYKNGYVIVHMKKAATGSWEQHARYLTVKNA
eukprot:GHVU01131495.1.p1 GENE.GHVU01131495.1~~GHVU01131495.1.p1  ORF type:complete len:117 (+),score=18.04 GHVU01131495.1:93-443(+)